MKSLSAVLTPDVQERAALPEHRAGARRSARGAKSSMTKRDYAWYRMDTNRNFMVINSILLFEGAVDMERLISTVAHRLPNYPRFTQKVVTKLGQPYWVEDDAFNILDHIKLEKMAHEVSRQELQHQLTAMAHTPLQENRPLWHMTVIDQVGGGYAIVFRVHHCITDGLGLVHVLNHLTDDNDSHGKVPSAEGHPHRGEATRQTVCSHIAKSISWLKVAAHVTRLSLLLPDARTQLKASLTGNKQLVWLPPIAIDQVRGVAKRMGVTLNDVWVAAVSDALRQYLAERGEQTDQRPVRAAVTFNLREKANAFQLGNEFGLVAVELPTDLDDPRLRLRESSRRMTAIKRSHQPRATMAFLSIAGCLPRVLQRFALNLFTSKGSVVLTNIEGPARPRYLAGSKMTDLICWVPQAGLIGVGFAFISYAGQIQLALFVDTELVDNPDRLMALTYAAFAKLDQATRADADVSHSSIHAEGLVAERMIATSPQRLEKPSMSRIRYEADSAADHKNIHAQGVHNAQPVSAFKSTSGVKRIFAAFGYSIDGFKAAWKNEHAFRQELALAAAGTIAALALDISAVEKLMLIGVLLLVLIVELLNSAIEAVVDRVSLERHALSKNAKDLGSAAVFLACVLGAATWGMVLFNRFY